MGQETQGMDTRPVLVQLPPKAWRRRQGGLQCFAGVTINDLFKIEACFVLQQHAILSALCIVETSFVFEQENPPNHNSRLCKGCLTDKKRVLHWITWHPQTPNLNSAEMLWEKLYHKVTEEPVLSISGDSRWKNILDDWLKTLFDRRSKVCRAFVKAKGGYWRIKKVKHI